MGKTGTILNFRIRSKSLRSSPNQSIKFRALKIDQYIPSGLSIDPSTTEQTIDIMEQ